MHSSLLHCEAECRVRRSASHHADSAEVRSASYFARLLRLSQQLLSQTSHCIKAITSIDHRSADHDANRTESGIRRPGAEGEAGVISRAPIRHVSASISRNSIIAVLPRLSIQLIREAADESLSLGGGLIPEFHGHWGDCRGCRPQQQQQQTADGSGRSVNVRGNWPGHRDSSRRARMIRGPGVWAPG